MEAPMALPSIDLPHKQHGAIAVPRQHAGVQSSDDRVLCSQAVLVVVAGLGRCRHRRQATPHVTDQPIRS